MATGDGWTSRLLAGLAEHLAAVGVGVWRPDGPPYTDDEVGIFDRNIPPTPDRIITLADYPVAEIRGMADVTIGVQIRVRGTSDPRVCRDIGDAIFDAIDSIGRTTWGGVAVVDCWRQSYTSLGKDANGRWEASHNYYVEAMRPTQHRTD